MNNSPNETSSEQKTLIEKQERLKNLRLALSPFFAESLSVIKAYEPISSTGIVSDVNSALSLEMDARALNLQNIQEWHEQVSLYKKRMLEEANELGQEKTVVDIQLTHIFMLADEGKYDEALSLALETYYQFDPQVRSVKDPSYSSSVDATLIAISFEGLYGFFAKHLDQCTDKEKVKKFRNRFSPSEESIFGHYAHVDALVAVNDWNELEYLANDLLGQRNDETPREVYAKFNSLLEKMFDKAIANKEYDRARRYADLAILEQMQSSMLISLAELTGESSSEQLMLSLQALWDKAWSRSTKPDQIDPSVDSLLTWWAVSPSAEVRKLAKEKIAQILVETNPGRNEAPSRKIPFWFWGSLIRIATALRDGALIKELFNRAQELDKYAVKDFSEAVCEGYYIAGDTQSAEKLLEVITHPIRRANIKAIYYVDQMKTSHNWSSWKVHYEELKTMIDYHEVDHWQMLMKNISLESLHDNDIEEEALPEKEVYGNLTTSNKPIVNHSEHTPEENCLASYLYEVAIGAGKQGDFKILGEVFENQLLSLFDKSTIAKSVIATHK